MSRAAIAIVVTAAGALTGCQDPYASDRTKPTPTPRAAAPVRGDVSTPGPAARPLPNAASRPSRAARGIAHSFAMGWINWNWQTAANQQRTLTQLAADDLARTLRANARSARIDATLARDRPGSRGTVAAIDLDRTGAHASGLVVTHEQSYTDGHADLGGKRYRVYLVTLRRENGTWEVVRWAPQP